MKPKLYELLENKENEIKYLVQIGVVSPVITRNLEIYRLYLDLREKGHYNRDCYMAIADEFKPRISYSTVKKVIFDLSAPVKDPDANN